MDNSWGYLWSDKLTAKTKEKAGVGLQPVIPTFLSGIISWNSVFQFYVERKKGRAEREK